MESIRLKRIRDGREDYEYLNLLAEAGRRAEALTIATDLFPSMYQSTVTQEALDAARASLIAKLEPGTLHVGAWSAAEGQGPLTFVVEWQSANPPPQDVTWSTGAAGTATSGSDYTAASGTLSFAPGESFASIDVPLVADVLDEANETFYVNFQPPPGSGVTPVQAKGTIIDDDPLPALGFIGGPFGDGDRLYTEGDTANVNALFEVALSTPSGRSVKVDFATGTSGTATSGVDYTAKTGSLTFAPGDTKKSFTVQVRPDTAEEIDEAFYVNLSGAPNATIVDGQSQVTIVDNDPPPPGSPTVAVSDATVVEGHSGTRNAVFTVTLTAPSTNTVTVPYATGTGGTATSGVDYRPKNGTLTFTPGQTSKIVNIAVNGDTVVEPNETFYLNLTSAAFATLGDSQGKGTIQNDDAP